MKQAKTTPAPKQSPPTPSDNLCKLLAERYPGQFAQWAFGSHASKLKVLKTELSREPVRADSVIFVSEDDEILHGEFQTTMKSDVPMPLRILDYYVGLKRQHPTRRIRQVLIVLKETGQEIPDRYEDERTLHRYDVIKMWEQDPQELLRHEGLLPLATLCRAESKENLLAAVATQIGKIKSPERRRETITMSRLLAGLRYDKNLVYRLFKEVEMLEESVVYQDIFHKGERRGEQRGRQDGALQEARAIAQRQLERRFGKLPLRVRRQLPRLGVAQLEALCDALLDFQTQQDMLAWFKQQPAKS